MVKDDIVEFIPKGRLIQIKSDVVRSDGTVVLDVRKDIYSAWKRWGASEIGIVYSEVIKSEGGNIIAGGIKMPLYFILQDGWKIQPPDNCKRIEVYGNLLSSDGKEPFAAKNDGSKIEIKKFDESDRNLRGILMRLSFIILLIALVLCLFWVCRRYNEFEPYVTSIVLIFTLVQLYLQDSDVKNLVMHPFGGKKEKG